MIIFFFFVVVVVFFFFLDYKDPSQYDVEVDVSGGDKQHNFQKILKALQVCAKDKGVYLSPLDQHVLDSAGVLWKCAVKG